MKLLVIDNAEVQDAAFNEPLINIVNMLADCRVLQYDNVTIAEDVAGVILSGSPLHYTFETIEEYQQHLGWLDTVQVPVLGVCFGHQVIGVRSGADIIRDKEHEDGIVPVHVVQDDPIFSDMPPVFRVGSMHRASISVPNEFMLLASSERCRNHIMRHKTKPIYTMQFHPELSPDGGQLIQNFIAMTRSSARAKF